MLRGKVLRVLTALGFFISSAAVAQDATTPPPAAPPATTPPPAEPPPAAPQSAVVGEAPAAAPAAPAAKGTEERTEEIVVTGTRIKRKDLTTPAPVTVINRDQIAASGKVSIGDFLQALPEQGNAINTGVNNAGDGATRINLRGIGTNRTLVLVNGRRWMPGGTGADGSVDLNSIPSAVVERIEVLKDGASAVYGSDAIAGVVNIITRRTGDKTDASVYTGVSGHGDGTTFDLNLTTGTGGERGNLLFSVGYYNQKKVMAGDRNFSRVPYGFDQPVGADGKPEAGAPYTAGSGTIPAGRSLTSGATGAGNALWNNLVGAGEGTSFIWTNEPAGPGYDGLSVFCGNNPIGQSQCFRAYDGAGLRDAGEVGDGYNFAPENYLVTPQQRIQLFSTGDAKIGDAARLFFEASYVNRRSGQDLAPEPLVSDTEEILTSANNMYNPFNKDVFVRRRLSEFGRRTYRQDIDTFRILGGLDGTLPDSFGPLAGWFWDVNTSYGRTAAVQEKKGNLYVPALAAALGPSKNNAAGRPTCVVDVAGSAEASIPDPTDPTATIPNPNVIAGCVPLNLFGGPGSITQDQVAGLTFTGTSHGFNELTTVQLDTSGELFRLMADRPVGLALGYEYRGVAGAYINDPITAKGLVTGNKGLDTQGSYYANEVYGELSIPIVSGLPFAQDLEATIAARWFDYSTFGSDSTYKIGARYRPIGDVTVRGTYSTAFRAPTIGELYGGQADNFAPVKDPCRGPAAGGPAVSAECIAAGVPAAGTGDTSSQLRSTVGGNPNLGPETAKVYTVGVVFEPRWVRNLSFTVDYYNMDIDKNISTYGENVILTGCYTGTNPEYCNLVTRAPSTHFIQNISNLNVNVGTLKTDGVDFAVRYALPTPIVGRFGFAVDATWLNKVNQSLASGEIIKGKDTFDLSAGGYGGVFPEWKFNAGITWALGGLGAGVTTRYLSGFHECGEPYTNRAGTVVLGGDFAGSGLCYVDSTFSRHVNAYHAEDLFVSYSLGTRVGKTNVMFGVSNVGDAPPTRIYNGFANNTDAYNYDEMGRFFYFRLAQTY